MKKKMICGILLFTILSSMTACGEKTTATENTQGSNYHNTSPTQKVETIYEYEGSVDDGYSYTAEAEYDYYSEPYSEPYYEPSYYKNTEKYNTIKETGFSSASMSPLSTFGADVDTASYSNFRRFVEDGYSLSSIPGDAIRTEEMLNYFTYNYKEPKNGDVFNVSATISDCPWNKEVSLLSLGINTKSVDKREIPPCNIVFLIDVSGSMSDDNKLPLVTRAINEAMDNFGKDDIISVVTYSSYVTTVLSGVRGDKKHEIEDALDSLYASGCTNGGEGLKTAYSIAEENFIEDGINRVIICSDGDFNVGITSEDALYNLISNKKDTGIFLSTLGFGMGNYSDVTMETLADNGNGNYAYIDTYEEAKKVLVEEMTSTLFTVAKDVKFQVEFNPATVSEYRLVGYENRSLSAKDFKDDTKDGGELGAGHQVTVLYEIKLNDGEDPYSNLKYQDSSEEKKELSDKGKSMDEYCTLSIAYKEPDKDTSEYLEYPIGVDNYTKRPDDDFVFASMVATTSLALRDSEYLEDYSPKEALDKVVDTLRDIELNDEYKEDFYYLVKLLKNK